MELTAQQSKIGLGGAAVAVCVGAYLIFFRPLAADLKKNYLEYRTIEAQAAEARKVIESVNVRDKGSAILTQKDVPFAIEELTKLGRKHRIDFISVNPKEVIKEAQFEILPIEAEFIATFRDFSMFLGSLDETKQSLITIDSFTVIINRDDPERVRARVAVNMYLLGHNG